MSRVDALGRLGGPTVECGCCFAKVIETQALYLRRLWIDREAGSRTQSTRYLHWACSLACAEKLEADALARHYSDPDSDSALWIDDSHLVVGGVIGATLADEGDVPSPSPHPPSSQDR